MSRLLDAKGKLILDGSTAIYFDSSVLIDYWLTEGHDLPVDKTMADIAKRNEPPYQDFVRKTLNVEHRLPKVTEIRKLLETGESDVFAIVTPPAILELTAWYADTRFRTVAAEVAGPSSLRQKGKKEIGRLLSAVLKAKRDEAQASQGTTKSLSALDMLLVETMLNGSFAMAHGLRGLTLVDIKGFELTISDSFSEAFFDAYVQVGQADLLHILAARHLGCTHIASFDVDFTRAHHLLNAPPSIQLLTTPDEILTVLGASKS